MSTSNPNYSISTELPTSGRCAACKYLRRRCSPDCILAPYFPSSHPHRFACVHRIFGASNVARILQHLPANERAQAADALSMEAYCRVQDPVYGSVGIISQLQHEIALNQHELAQTQAQIAMHSTANQHQHQAEPNHPAMAVQQQYPTLAATTGAIHDFPQFPYLFGD